MSDVEGNEDSGASYKPDEDTHKNSVSSSDEDTEDARKDKVPKKKSDDDASDSQDLFGTLHDSSAIVDSSLLQAGPCGEISLNEKFVCKTKLTVLSLLSPGSQDAVTRMEAKMDLILEGQKKLYKFMCARENSMMNWQSKLTHSVTAIKQNQQVLDAK